MYKTANYSAKHQRHTLNYLGNHLTKLIFQQQNMEISVCLAHYLNYPILRDLTKMSGFVSRKEKKYQIHVVIRVIFIPQNISINLKIQDKLSSNAGLISWVKLRFVVGQNAAC